MTAPAVVHRWNDPPPVRVDRTVLHEPVATETAGQTAAAVRARAREALVRLGRVAPLSAVLFTGLLAHITVAPHLSVRGVAPDALLVAVVAVAISRGSRTGAGFGFAAGLAADLFLATPPGTSALAYTLVGHAFGRCSRPRPPGSAAALCRPGSTCFACRTGRLHTPALPRDHQAGVDLTARPSRARRRAAARRAALRRSVLLTAVGVGAGHLATVIVATTLAGVPVPEAASLLRIAGIALLSAPLGPIAAAALLRLGRAGGDPA